MLLIGVFCVASSLKTEVLVAFTCFLMLYQAFTPLLILPQTSHSINLIHDHNFMLSPVGLPANH